MSDDKIFLTYNRQMKKLRKDKKINCSGTPHKTAFVRSGYFNIINGYKMPFTCGFDTSGNHIYFPDTSLELFKNGYLSENGNLLQNSLSSGFQTLQEPKGDRLKNSIKTVAQRSADHIRNQVRDVRGSVEERL